MRDYNVLLIDDHTLLRETWADMINSLPYFSVSGTSGSAEEGLELAKAASPDIVILDINLPGMNGLEATQLFCKFVPGIKVIGVSLHNQPTFSRLMIRNGAMGYVTKTSGIDELFLAMQEVVKGKKYICTEVKSIIANQLLHENEDPVTTLSKRELQVIQMIREGDSSKDIASKLGLSVKTVEVHRYNILKKLKLKNAASLVQYISTHPHLVSGGSGGIR